jgi:uncharacterized protein
MSDAREPFWRTKSLAEMTREEWESLCDGCGKCCLIKLQDEDGDEVDYTDVACRLLDLGACRCTRYAERKELVPECVVLTPGKLDRLPWMPSTCAYRLLHEGKDLPWWHPLVSGDPEDVHRAGISVRGRVVPEARVAEEDLEDRIVEWPR